LPPELRHLTTRENRDDHLGQGLAVRGTAVVDLPHTTVLVPPDVSAALDEGGNIVMELR
jgi:hypothetical protein